MSSSNSAFFARFRPYGVVGGIFQNRIHSLLSETSLKILERQQLTARRTETGRSKPGEVVNVYETQSVMGG